MWTINKVKRIIPLDSLVCHFIDRIEKLDGHDAYGICCTCGNIEQMTGTELAIYIERATHRVYASRKRRRTYRKTAKSSPPRSGGNEQ